MLVLSDESLHPQAHSELENRPRRQAKPRPVSARSGAFLAAKDAQGPPPPHGVARIHPSLRHPFQRVKPGPGRVYH